MQEEHGQGLVVGGKSGGLDVVHPIAKVGLLEERPVVSGGREKTQREALQCQVENDKGKGSFSTDGSLT